MNIYEASTIVIAASAFGVAIWQSWIARQHNYLSVQPYLRFKIQSGTTANRLILCNLGIGPAIIGSFSITDPSGLRSIGDLAVQIHEDGIGVEYGSFPEGAVLEAGLVTSVLAAKTKLSGDERKVFWQAIEGMELLVEYKSLYGVKQPALRYKVSLESDAHT